MRILIVILASFLALFPDNRANAQSAQVAFGGLKQDTSLPVEVSADQLKVSQSDGTATFTGNVVIGQGEMRLSAAVVLVEYASSDSENAGSIARMVASGGVTLVNGAEAAEAENAEYSIDAGTVVMTGSVILLQGDNALSADKMVVDLNTGTAALDGRVRTVFQTGGN